MLKSILPTFLLLLLFTTSLFAQINLDSGLVASYPFTGNAVDSSGNGHNGVLYGVTQTTGRTGLPNTAYHFNGTNNYIQVPNSSSLTPSSVITMCAVVRPMGFNSSHCQGNTILMKGPYDMTTGLYELAFGDNGYDGDNCNVYDPLHETFIAQLSTNLPSSVAMEYSDYIVPGTWYCVTGTYNGSLFSLYVDGILKWTVPTATPLGVNSSPLTFGHNIDPSFPYWFNGDIDDIRIYDRVLNPAEIMEYYTLTSGLTFDHYIHGTLYNDSSQDCHMQSGEQRLPFYTLTGTPGNYYTVADDSGRYSLGVNNSATYTVQPLIPQYLSPLAGNPCPVFYSIPVTASTPVDTDQFDFGFHIANCALLRVDITGDRKHRCFRNNTTVYYSNEGTAEADTVTVYVHFDQYDIPISASLPYTWDTITNTLIFNIGTLTAGQNGIITIVDSIACVPSITGLTQCTDAWILPPNNCLIDSTTGPGWDHSSMTVDGACMNDTCRFVIRNNGSGDMAVPQQYRIYANNVLVYTGSYQLISGDSLVVLWVSGGATIRLEADQHPDHPGHSHPRYTLEACGTDSIGNYSTGEVNRAPMDDEDVDVEIDCMQIRDSYDPNEKDNAPEGVTNAHTVLPNTPIDFTIHFQNTGTDTAFRVVVIDSLSNDLDLATLELGAASHPYSASLSGQGVAVLKFTFSNINLSDSATDELNSHGFVKYKISPKSATPLGTRINNSADIYFDYNFPVRTNTAFVTLGNELVLGVTQSALAHSGSVVAYPNPAKGFITVEVPKNNSIQSLVLYSADGRIVKSMVHCTLSTVNLDLQGLSGGIYYLDCRMERGSEKVKVVKY